MLECGFSTSENGASMLQVKWLESTLQISHTILTCLSLNLPTALTPNGPADDCACINVDDLLIQINEYMVKKKDDLESIQQLVLGAPSTLVHLSFMKVSEIYMLNTTHIHIYSDIQVCVCVCVCVV